MAWRLTLGLSSEPEILFALTFPETCSFLVAPNGQNEDQGAVPHLTAEGLVADAIPTCSVYLSENKTQLTIAFTGSRVYRNSMQTLV